MVGCWHPCYPHHQIRIDGQTPPKARQGLVDRFQTTRSIRVALLSICACGTLWVGAELA